jgi:hypothetical protein
MGLFIIAVIVLLICVCVSRIGSKDLREVAVAVEVVFSIATVGAAISLPFAIKGNTQIIGKHAVLKETLEAADRKNYYLISSDVLELNYTINFSFFDSLRSFFNNLAFILIVPI